MAKLVLSPLVSSVQGSAAQASFRQTSAGTILTKKPRPPYVLTAARTAHHADLADFRDVYDICFDHYNTHAADSPSVNRLGYWGWLMRNAWSTWKAGSIPPVFPLDAKLASVTNVTTSRPDATTLQVAWEGPHDTSEYYITILWMRSYAANPRWTSFSGTWLNKSADASPVSRHWPCASRADWFAVGYIRKSDGLSSGLLPAVHIDYCP